MFNTNFDITGIHANYLKDLCELRGNVADKDQHSNFKIFKAYIDAYILCPLIGYQYSRKGKMGSAADGDVGILAEQIIKRSQELKYVYQILMLVDEESEPDEEKRIYRAFNFSEKTDEDKEPEKTTIFYVTDPVQQSQYINMFKEAGKNAVILSHNIDTAFISHLEQKDQTIQFKRIDADLTEELKGDGAADEETAKTLTELFRKSLNKDKLEVKVENLKNESVAAMMTLSEESRRMQDMMKMYNMYGMDPSMFGGQETLVLNANHPLVQFLGKNQESEHAAVICEQLYDLAMLSHKQLSPDEMTKFVKRSNEILMMIAK